MKEKLIVRGRLVTPADIVFIRSFIEKYHDKGRILFLKNYVATGIGGNQMGP